MFVRFRTYLMEAADATPPGGAPPAPAAATPAPPAPAAPAPGEEFKSMTPEQFAARLVKEREQGTKSLLKEFGFKDPDEAKSFFTTAQKEADAKKTEAQLMTEKLAKMEPLASKAESYEKAIAGYLAAEEALIPEDKKALLELAPPVENPQARLDWISKAKAKNLFAADPAPAATAADATKTLATTRAGSGPPPPPAPPPGAKHPREMSPEEFKRYETQKLGEHTVRR